MAEGFVSRQHSITFDSSSWVHVCSCNKSTIEGHGKIIQWKQAEGHDEPRKTSSKWSPMKSARKACDRLNSSAETWNAEKRT